MKERLKIAVNIFSRKQIKNNEIVSTWYFSQAICLMTKCKISDENADARLPFFAAAVSNCGANFNAGVRNFRN